MTDSHVSIARITALQAVIVALISAAAGVVTTILTSRSKDAKDSAPGPVLEAQQDVATTKLENNRLRQQVAELSDQLTNVQRQLVHATFSVVATSVPIDPPMSLNSCKQQASAKVSALGAAVSTSSSGVSGTRNGVVIIIECVAARGMAIGATYVGAAATEDEARRTLAEIK